MPNCYRSDDLLKFATTLLLGAGMPPERAAVVAEILLEGDLLGHTTHGLQLLSPYLKSIEAGTMTVEGEPEIVRETGATATWDGRSLPGPWLVTKAIDWAESRLPAHGVVTVAIRQSHHIACLQAYLKRVTDRGRIILLMSSDPSVASVAPHGGLKPVYTPNPIAAGIPAGSNPILIDISSSTTTNGMAMRLHKRGQSLPHSWLQDASGRPTADPAVLFSDPPGAILPLGGLDLGHKGFALGLLVEALTSALAGAGRANAPKQWGASVFLQLIDPALFGGGAAFAGSMSFLAKACHESSPRPGEPPVRLPGEAGLKRRETQLAHGVELFPGILESLQPWAEKFSVPIPQPTR